MQPIRLIHNYWGVFAVAADHRLPVHLPADAVLRHRHRPGAGAGGGDARRRRRGSASATSSCRCWRPGSRSPSACPSCRPSRCSRRRCCSARRPGPTRVISIAAYRGRLRAVRLFAGLGDRDDHGRWCSSPSSSRCWRGAACSIAARRRRERLSDDPRHDARRKALGDGRLGRWSASSSSTSWR